MRLPGRRSPGSSTGAAGSADGATGPDAAGASPAETEPDGSAVRGTGQAAASAKVKRPLYPRLLRLRHVRPNAWQRAALGEGALALAVVLVLADVASAWTLLALPLAVAAIVKAHDVLAGLLARPPHGDPGGPGT